MPVHLSLINIIHPLKVPPYLQAGDTVGILATARSIQKEDLQAAISMFEAWGWKVQLGNTIGKVQDQFGGSDQERATDLQAMLDDPNIKAIICARGGYGTVRLLDKLNFNNFCKHPKWIVGFSDITVLHSYIHQQCQVQTLHATMPSVYDGNSPASLTNIRTALIGETLQYQLNPHPFNRAGEFEGQLVGGNLSILYSLMGSDADIDTRGKVLFIEDLDEYLYHIDRMMIALKRSGKLESLAALIVGGMSDMNDNTTPFGKTAEAIILEHLADYDYPLIFDFPAGHISDNFPLILGRKVSINMKEMSFVCL